MAASATIVGQIQPRWYRRARIWITDKSKGINELLAAIGEPLMRFSTIYLALATGIPVIKVMPAYTACQGIVIAVPEFVILGALGVAEGACSDPHNKKWGKMLYGICALLALIMIATFADIFIYQFPDVAIKSLNFSRCLVAVGFSIVLGKLDQGKENEQSQSVVQSQPVQSMPVQSLRNHQVQVSAVKFTKKVNSHNALVHLVNQVTAEDIVNPSSSVPAPAHRAAPKLVNPLSEQQATHTAPRSKPAKVNHQDTEPLHIVRQVNPEPPKVQSEPPASSVTETAVNHQGKQSEQGDKGSAVQQFIAAQLAQGKKPSLKEIEESCRCSRNTAIKHRRAMCPDDAEAKQPKLSIVN